YRRTLSFGIVKTSPGLVFVEATGPWPGAARSSRPASQAASAAVCTSDAWRPVYSTQAAGESITTPPATMHSVERRDTVLREAVMVGGSQKCCLTSPPRTAVQILAATLRARSGRTPLRAATTG